MNPNGDDKDGGRIISEEMASKFHELFMARLPPLFGTYSTESHKPLTLKQRLRVRWSDLKWWLHDRMFGEHDYDDD